MFHVKLTYLLRPVVSSVAGRFASTATIRWHDHGKNSKVLTTWDANGIERNFSVQATAFPNYAKKEVPFKYERKPKPDKVFNSGDTEGLQEVDLSKPLPLYEKSEELKTADDPVKQLCSLEFAKHGQVLKVQIKEMMSKVQRHPLDVSSPEARVAIMTVRIRNLQVHLRNQFGRDKSGKSALNELIDARKKQLKLLRKADYQRFEWLLGVLNITYHPPPRFFYSPTRKGTLRSMTRDHCIQVRQKKIEAFRESLKAQQAAFLKEKEEALKWIQQQEKELNIDPKETEEPLFVPPTVKLYRDPDITPPKDYVPPPES